MRGVFASEGKLEDVVSAEDVAMTAGGKEVPLEQGCQLLQTCPCQLLQGGNQN